MEKTKINSHIKIFRQINSVVTYLELLKFKNRQMEMPTFTLMKDQAVTKAIQMFPPFAAC